MAKGAFDDVPEEERENPNNVIRFSPPGETMVSDDSPGGEITIERSEGVSLERMKKMNKSQKGRDLKELLKFKSK